MLGRLAAAIAILAIQAGIFFLVSFAIMFIAFWVLERLVPSRIRWRKLERLANKTRNHLAPDERKRRDQELGDHISVDVVSVSNTEAVLSVCHTVPDLSAGGYLNAKIHVTFFTDDGEDVGWGDHHPRGITASKQEITVKRTARQNPDPVATSCIVQVIHPIALTTQTGTEAGSR